MLVDRVMEIVRRYAMVQAGARVGVAVSGGADSVCLLHVLFEIAPRWPLQLSVLHLDHGLRGAESDEDARFVKNLADSLQLPAHMARARLETSGEANLEQAGREARHDFFLSFLRAGTLDRIATAHTRSDQAETVLFRLLRGAGTAGLAGIRPVIEPGIVRPLLGLDREEIIQYLTERRVSWREDSSNASLEFARNRIRRKLLPQLRSEWNPGLDETLARLSDLAYEEERYWEREIAGLARMHLNIKPPAVFLNANKLSGLERAVARRLARRAIELVKGDLRQIDFLHVEQVLDLASAPEGHGRIQLPGVDVYRSFGEMRLAPPGMDTLANRNFRFPLPVPGAVELPGHFSIIQVELIEAQSLTVSSDSRYNEIVDCLDWERISGPLELRNWRPGDQYRPAGRSGEEKIKVLFQQAKVPLWERRNWPVITSGETIIWARRFGPASNLAATSHTRAVLRIREAAV